jgi:hypothetical protein
MNQKSRNWKPSLLFGRKQSTDRVTKQEWVAEFKKNHFFSIVPLFYRPNIVSTYLSQRRNDDLRSIQIMFSIIVCSYIDKENMFLQISKNLVHSKVLYVNHFWMFNVSKCRNNRSDFSGELWPGRFFYRKLFQTSFRSKITNIN